jgi:outer membrane immunogenic protein
MRKLAAALALGTALAVSAPAFAADIVEEQAYDWTGVYAGVFAGVGYTSSDWNGTDDDVVTPDQDVDESLNDTQLLLGGLVGANYQHDRWVFGAEADLAWFDSDKDKHLDGAEGLDIKSEIDLLGTVRARAGIAADRTLFFLTGGLAFSDAEHTWDDGSSGPEGSDPWNGPPKKMHLDFGWVVGAGIEHAWTDDLLVRIEGLYIDLGSEHGHLTAGDGVINEHDSFDVDQEIFLGRAALILKLN